LPLITYQVHAIGNIPEASQLGCYYTPPRVGAAMAGRQVPSLALRVPASDGQYHMNDVDTQPLSGALSARGYPRVGVPCCQV
jgi:hypothetical protein